MNNVDKLNTFGKEFQLIKSVRIREFAKQVIISLPDYFFEIPASSTGKYHPDYALGEGGLVRHTRAAVGIAYQLFRTDLWKLTQDEQDLILVSLLAHDGYKSGVDHEKYSRADHPKIVTFEMKKDVDLGSMLSKEEFEFFLANIETHMGKWNMDYKTHQQILEKPKTVAQRLTHLADYIASRKSLEYNFDVSILES